MAVTSSADSGPEHGMTTPTFSIVVPTARRPEILRQTLTALVGVDFDPTRFELVVVDDALDPRTEGVVKALRPSTPTVTLVSQDRLGVVRARNVGETHSDGGLTLVSHERRGVARARNVGARHAAGDLLLFCDDDILVEPSHLVQHLATRNAHGDALIAGVSETSARAIATLSRTPFGRFRINIERGFRETSAFPHHADWCIEPPVLSAANLCLRRDLFLELGGFDDTFRTGAEDHEFSLRARLAGHPLLLDPRIRCIHDDDWLTLADCCRREERNASGMPLLARRHPNEYMASAYVRENTPIAVGDPPSLMAKKLGKQVLASEPTLTWLRRLTEALGRLPVPERLLWRIYRVVLGLYLFRGFREAWTSAS